MVVKTPQAVKDIIDQYDLNLLITQTIPDTYVLPSPQVLENYACRSKFDTPTLIELNDAAKSRLKALINSSNYDQNPVVILSYLIEIVCDVSKIQTKAVAHALDSYYTLASLASRAHRDDAYSLYASLFKKLLNAYEDSGFSLGNGLSEEHIAMFLTVSPEGKALVRKIDKLIN